MPDVGLYFKFIGSSVVDKSLRIEQFEWFQSQPITHQLPYTFANGLVFNGINCQCGQCGDQISSDSLRGTLSALSGQRCLMSAKGYCETCQTLTCFNFLIDGQGEPRIIDIDESSLQ